MPNFRNTIAVDFDGVIHSYESGWKGVDNIPDQPVPGSIGWLIGMCLYTTYEIAIFSARCRENSGKQAILYWIEKHVRAALKQTLKYRVDDGEEMLEDDVATILASIAFIYEKPAEAFIFIDDRAWQFNGTFPSLIELNNFQPWNKR